MVCFRVCGELIGRFHFLFDIHKFSSSPQPAPPRDAHFVSTKKNEPQLLEPIPYEFMA